MNRQPRFSGLGRVMLCLVVSMVSLGLHKAQGEEGAQRDEGLENPVFAVQNGVMDSDRPSPEDQATLLAQTGYQGMGPSGTQGIPELLAAFDHHGLKIYAQYIGANVDEDQPKFDPGLPAAIEQLAGRETFVWLFVQGRQFARASEAGDARAVAIVREVGQMAARHGLRVALYPHAGFYIETLEDAVRIADQVHGAIREEPGLTGTRRPGHDHVAS